jgi:hypothetical protein
MGTDEKPDVDPVERHRVRSVVLFCRNLVSHAKELGEIARIEIEIQNRFPHSAAPPRCPRWHDDSSRHGPHAPR